VLLIPLFGYHGAAWAALVCYFAITAISYFAGQKYYPVRYPLRRIFLFLGLAVALYAVKALLPVSGLWWGIAVSVVLFAIYVGVVVMRIKFVRG
jgi:uncharacterized protein YqhQ